MLLCMFMYISPAGYMCESISSLYYIPVSEITGYYVMHIFNLIDNGKLFIKVVVANYVLMRSVKKLLC